MPAEQIYSLELAIYRIELEPNVTIKNYEGLHLNFKFSNKVNFDIDTQYFSPPKVESDSDGRNIDMNYGKTCLFIAKPYDLRELLQREPFQCTLFEGNKPIGTSVNSWKREFPEMVKFFETLGIVKSTTAEEWFELKNDGGKKTGKVNLFIRMSCFGTNVQTMFQIKKGLEDGPEYVFRQRNRSKSFKVSKYEDGRCQPVIAPLYGAVTDPKSGQESQVNMRENASLTQLWDREVAPKLSTFQGPEEGNTGGINLDFGDNFDTVSICFRATENTFFDFLNVISENVKTQGTAMTITKKNAKRVEAFMKSVGGDIKESPNIIIEEDDDTIRSTAEHVAKNLCGNKDCPAVKKFKEYGIGPLATGKNLGTLYHDDMEPHVTYGMSQTYGTTGNFGPFGLILKPKTEEVPEEPVNEPDVETMVNEPNVETVKPCKIRKVVKSKTSKKEKKKDPQWHSKGCPLCHDRLRGGADDLLGEELMGEMDEDGTIMPKSPMMECKSVMDQFDSILAEYKKALGPCGHPTCPFAQTLADDSCKKACEQPAQPPSKTSAMSCNDDPCDFEECPYGGEPKKTRYPAGCGNPKCAYTKYKLGLVDADAELELQFLPPALGGNCGSPQCKYPLAPPLPPIHWDCPDPLPRGPCQNLNCPFQPPRLKKFKTKKQLKTGPCGSPMCPYALPQPCSVPTCPFSARPCPMNEGQNQRPREENQPSNGNNKCENPVCPFAESNAGQEVEEIDDPLFEGEFQDCENPDCPYKKKNKKKKSKEKKRETPCGNPECPFSKPSKKDKKKSKKQKCNENGESNEEKNDNCENPACPFAQPGKEEKKKKKKKKEKSESDDSECDTDCPYKKKKEKNRCLESSSDSVSICSDPECPYAELKQMKNKRRGEGDADNASCSIDDDESLCSNPECPERLAREQEDPNACPVPGCPYSNKVPKSNVCIDPKCPYLQPLPSCGIPNCPYEPIPVRFNCKNPACPSHKVDFSKKIDRSKLSPPTEDVIPAKKQPSERQTGQDNSAVPMKTPCDETVPCDKPEECENPDCDMTEGDGKGSKTQQKKDQALQQKKKGKRRKKGKFVYSIGDTYPVTKLGHKECVMPVFNVPPNMGWLWNIFTPILQLKPRRGWRPGALTRTIAARIRAHRESKGLGQLKVPDFKGDGTNDDDSGDPKVVPKPTLQIQKKEGAYWITMNPLKDPFSLVENEDPYMDCTPMTFKITKNKKQDDDYCCCDGEEPPENLSSSSSDSELDIEFTPPAGIIHPERFKKKPNIVCCECQYDPKDFEVEKKEKGGKKGAKGKDKDGKKGDKGGKKGGKKK